MYDNRNNMDELFSREFERFEAEPSYAVWDKLEKSLEKRRRAVVWLWVTRVGLAASLLVAFGTGWYFAMQRQPIMDTQTAEIMTKNTEPNDSFQNSNKPEIETNQATPNTPSVLGLSSEKMMSTENQSKNKKEKIVTSVEHVSSTASKTLNYNELLTLMESKPYTIIPAGQPSGKLIGIADHSYFLNENDRAIIAANIESSRNQNEHAVTGKKWSVGAQVSPDYHFNENNNKYDQSSLQGVNVPSVASGYELKVAGGLKFAYQASEKVSIQTGVNYTTYAQNSCNVPVSFAGHNWIGLRNDYSFQDGSYGTSNKASATNSNPAALNTQMGLANISMPSGTEVSINNAMTTTYAEYVQNYRFSQQANYLELPLLARIQVVDRAIGMHLLGGINTNVLLRNQVQLMDRNSVLAKGQLEGLRNLAFSSSLGVGIDYGLGDRFKLFVEPLLKIMLSDMNTDENFHVTPYTFGIYTGISYKF
jgi:hypothetical protein